VIDRFKYQPDPGGLMLPGSGHNLVLDRILLTALGSRRRWAYRWTAEWTYTFWRPSAPGFPLSAGAEPEVGQFVVGEPIRGSRAGASPIASIDGAEELADVPAAGGDTVAVDRETRTITITVR
jgi:hypothetical protein